MSAFSFSVATVPLSVTTPLFTANVDTASSSVQRRIGIRTRSESGCLGFGPPQLIA